MGEGFFRRSRRRVAGCQSKDHCKPPGATTGSARLGSARLGSARLGETGTVRIRVKLREKKDASRDLFNVVKEHSDEWNALHLRRGHYPIVRASPDRDVGLTRPAWWS